MKLSRWAIFFLSEQKSKKIIISFILETIFFAIITAMRVSILYPQSVLRLLKQQSKYHKDKKIIELTRQARAKSYKV